jgi:hypothetical protein
MSIIPFIKIPGGGRHPARRSGVRTAAGRVVPVHKLARHPPTGGGFDFALVLHVAAPPPFRFSVSAFRFFQSGRTPQNWLRFGFGPFLGLDLIVSLTLLS